MLVEATPDTASLLEPGGAAAPVAVGVSPPPKVQTSGFRSTRPGLSRRIPATPSQPPQMDTQDEEALGELVDRLRDMQRSFKSEKGSSSMDPKDRAAMMNKVISEFKSSRVSDEEAEKLEDLGKQLNGTKVDSINEKRRELRRRLDLPDSTKGR